MTRQRLTHWLVVLLGLLYVAAGIAETVRLEQSGDGGLVFWFGTLVGGGSLVLLGELLHSRRQGLGATLISAGCLVGIPATLWSLLVPVLALAVMMLALKRLDDHTSAALGQPPGPDAA